MKRLFYFTKLFLNVKNNDHIGVVRKFSNVEVRFDYQKSETMKVLNVAEKNDAAKNIAGHLSRGTSRRREGLSKFNKIYEFNANLWNQNCQMIMTSVSGHLLTHEFVGNYRKWYGCSPLHLFEAPISKICPQDSYVKIKKTLEKEIRSCDALIIWTDCDREGENIGYEIIDVCKAVKSKIKVYRAKFSEITQISVERALQNLEQPNKALSDAVDVRSELDLRIGAAFTRFQTMRLQKTFPRNLSDMLISYGPCQFPTLGFVVERFLAIERFQPEPYWKLKVTHTQNDLTVEFRWARNRLFEKLPCEVFLDICQENPQATVEKITSKPKSKWRPLPLDTIEMEKQGSRKLRLSAKETMKIAEKLYTQGFISYPRTETNIFPKEMNLTSLVSLQTENPAWGGFAQGVLQDGITPRQGKKSDQAHPPIHPTKYTDTLQGDEKRVYEFVVRHFLACVSKNAEGFETIVEIDIAGEKFITNGLQIIAKNYLEVYIYEKWNAKEIHIYNQGQTFMPTSIDMLEESTSPPNLLTEADLIALMDKHGIGTDATHAEHIETIKSRHYVGLKDNKYLIPGKLGIGLVMGYDRMGFEMSKPNLRAELESDLKGICDGVKQPDEVRQRIIAKYREVFVEAMTKANMIDAALSEYLDERPANVVHGDIPAPADDVPILKCPKCDSNMVVKTKRQGKGKYIGCMSFPTCNNVIWLPEAVEDVETLNERCNQCPDNILKKIKVKLTRNVFAVYGTSHTTCIGGCDEMFNNLMGIRLNNVRRARDLNDTGYESNATNTSTRTPNNNPPPRRNQNANSSGSSWNSTNQDRQPTPAARGQQNQNGNFSGSSWNSTNQNRQQTSAARGQQNQSGNFSGSSWNSSSESRPQAVRPNDNWSAHSSRAGNNTSNNSGWNNDSENNQIMCNCHQAAKLLTVRKEGPNQGRTFYKCSKPSGQDCNFFLWGSEDDAARGGGGGGDGGGGGGRGSGSNNRNQNQNFQNNKQSSANSWQNSSNSRQNNHSSFNTSGNWDEDDGRGWNNDNQVLCTCGNAAKKLTVQKEGANKGRQFYGCPQGFDSPCNFFQWATDADGSGGGGGGGSWGGPPPAPNRGRGRGRGGGATRGSAPKRSRGAGTTGEGTKRKCGVCGIEGHTKRTCTQNRG